ncbi:MAG: hypothetical protein J5I90_16600 [Caldilineales bacterium]|nr:hypothetical protein [Caldilineales bacterium]
MHATFEVENEALPLIRSSVEMKRQALEFSLLRYRKQLAEFESRYQMTSATFQADFSAGKLGDEPSWFEWEYLLEALAETKHQLHLIASLKL